MADFIYEDSNAEWDGRMGSAHSWSQSERAQGFFPIDRGLGVRHHNVSPADNGANARLYSQGGQYLSLWVYEVEASFEMAGTRAQGKGHRDFYPHNFVQPALTIRGQTANNYQYNLLSMFVRRTQLRGVFPASGDEAVTFVLDKGGRDTARGTKGAHQKLVISGFIPAIAFGAKRFQFAHEYEFQFVVTKSKLGLMQDEDVVARKLKSWAEIVIKPDDAAYVKWGDTAFEDVPTDAGSARLLALSKDQLGN